MNFKKLFRWAVPGLLLLLTGCNIFNPNASTEGSCPASDAECYISLGLSLSQTGHQSASMEAYAKAIAIDSSKSQAYWGYASSASLLFAVNLGSLLQDIQKAGNKDLGAFTDHSNAEVTRRIQLCAAILKTLDPMLERDSLTRWYEYLTDSSKANSDTSFHARREFIRHYLDTVTAPSRKAEKFPLMDRKQTFSDQLNFYQYLPYKMMYKFLDFYNLEPKEVFDDHDRLMADMLSADGSLGGIGPLADAMREDTALQIEVNDKIVALQNGVGDLVSLLSEIGVAAPADTGGAPAQSKAQMDSAITGLGGTLVFYQFGDHLDNDADGCIDEEIVDSLDNDLDGFVDEDARLINGTTSATGDHVNNDRQNGIDDALENKVGGLFPTNPRPYILTFVAQHLNSAHEFDTPEANTTWIYIKKGSPQIDARIAVQKDSLAVHLTPGQPVPAEYVDKLNAAKTQVGGCWRFY